jgi:RNA polymerase sigma factor (sigma-70 family)
MELFGEPAALLRGNELEGQGTRRVAREPGGPWQRHLHTLFNVGVTANQTDGQLLERFATLRGEAAELAFAALVERHGPMVFRACRGILENEHDAHDAFQATFMILLRKGNSLWVRDSLGPWLHRVACRAAARAKVKAQRRRVHERRAAEQACGRRAVDSAGELAAVLHEEVDRLPDRYRVPIVLCDLQGRTYEEAARHLQCPVGTIRSRLARGRDRLRCRLTLRGLAPSAAVVSAALAPDAASAAMPAAWAESTIKCARFILAGGALTAGEVPASVLAITEEVLKVMTLGKRTLIAASVLTAIGLAVGAGILSQQTAGKPHPLPKQSQVADLDRRWVATLPGGGAIELLGVSTYPSGPDSWWRPDGSPLAEAPCDSPPRNLGLDRSLVLLVIAARVTGLPADANSGLRVKEAGGRAYSLAKKDGKEVPGVNTVLVGLPKDLATCTAQFHAATGPWKTMGISDGRSPRGVSKPGLSYTFEEAVAGGKGTILTVSHNIGNDAVRIVAVDRSGKERPHVNEIGSGGKDSYNIRAEFDLDPDAIQEYRLQTRPFERVEVKGIALKPSGPG